MWVSFKVFQAKSIILICLLYLQTCSSNSNVFVRQEFVSSFFLSLYHLCPYIHVAYFWGRSFFWGNRAYNSVTHNIELGNRANQLWFNCAFLCIYDNRIQNFPKYYFPLWGNWLFQHVCFRVSTFFLILNSFLDSDLNCTHVHI